MRYFLILLFSVITFCAKSQVIISEQVARFFLEQSDKVRLLEKHVKIKETIINKKDSIIVQQTIIINSYKEDSLKYEMMLANKDSVISNKDREMTIIRKSLGRTKFQRDLVIGVGAGVTTGFIVGQPLVGGLAGASVIIFRKIFKTNK